MSKSKQKARGRAPRVPRPRWPLALLALALFGGAGAWWRWQREATPPRGSAPAFAVPDPPTTEMEPAVREALVQSHRRVLADPGSAEAWGWYAAELDVHGFLGPAEPCYRQARALAPEDIRHAYNLAILLEKLGGEPEEVLELYRLVADRQPDFPPVHMRIGLVLAGKGELEAAVAAYQTALRQDPQLQIARRSLGRAWIELEQFARAVSELGIVAASAPEDGPTQAALSQAYLGLGDTERSAAAGERARTRVDTLTMQDPLNFIVVSLGRSAYLANGRVDGRFASGDFAGAVEDLKIVLRTRPNDPKVHERLAEAYQRLGQGALAQQEQAEARRLRAAK